MEIHVESFWIVFLFLGGRLRLDSFRGLGARALGTLAVDGLELYVAGGDLSHDITTLSCGCHLQDESSVWGNEAWETLGTVGVVTVLWSVSHGSNACMHVIVLCIPSNGEGRLLAERHAAVLVHDSLVPA